METPIFKLNSILNLTFYPTYKEWKRKTTTFFHPSFFTFYPTYKEWKRSSIFSIICPTPPFYPTYKEWKP